MRDTLEVIGAGFLIIIAVVLAFTLLFSPIIAIECKSQIEKCKQIDGTDINHEWSFWTGCRVERPNGMWIAIDDYYTSELILDLVGQGE